MILGLDVSTRITGITVLDDSGTIAYIEAIRTDNNKKYKTIYDKARHIRNKLIDLNNRFKINSIYIEEPFVKFQFGKSSAATISLLLRFNGIVSFLCSSIFGVDPEHINASTSRKLCGIKVEKGRKAKEFALEYLTDNEPVFTVEYTRSGNPKPGTYDCADSYVIAKAGYERQKNKL